MLQGHGVRAVHDVRHAEPLQELQVHRIYAADLQELNFSACRSEPDIDIYSRSPSVEEAAAEDVVPDAAPEAAEDGGEGAEAPDERDEQPGHEPGDLGGVLQRVEDGQILVHS